MELSDYLNLPYTVTLRRDDEGDWIARIQELSGCVAHGNTEVEALERLRDAKRDWIAAALEDHIDVPLPESEDELPSGKWVQRVPRSLHKQLAMMAKTERTSLNSLVTSILSDYVGRTRHAVTVITGGVVGGGSFTWGTAPTCSNFGTWVSLKQAVADYTVSVGNFSSERIDEKVYTWLR